jgi:hypothetical protein
MSADIAATLARIEGEVKALSARFARLDYMPGDGEYLSTTEAAAFLGVSAPRLSQLRAEGAIRTASGPGRRVFYHRGDLETLKKQRYELQPE